MESSMTQETTQNPVPSKTETATAESGPKTIEERLAALEARPDNTAIRGRLATVESKVASMEAEVKPADVSSRVTTLENAVFGTKPNSFRQKFGFGVPQKSTVAK